MSADVVTCAADDSVEELMVSMTERRIRHLPVVDGEGLLAGIVSIGDVVKARLGQLETENQALVRVPPPGPVAEPSDVRERGRKRPVSDVTLQRRARR